MVIVGGLRVTQFRLNGESCPALSLFFFKMMLQLSNISKQVIHELSLQSRLDLGRMRVNLAFMVLSASVFNLQARRA